MPVPLPLLGTTVRLEFEVGYGGDSVAVVTTVDGKVTVVALWIGEDAVPRTTELVEFGKGYGAELGIPEKLIIVTEPVTDTSLYEND